jgi:serine/threonine protein kinase
MLQTTTEHSPFGNVHCPQCDTILPPQAIFCGSCGERVSKEKKGPSLTQDGADATSRYRITSLVRHRPYVKLFFSVDNQQQRMVVIRDIDISSLNEEAQAKASEVTEREYDLLRQQRITHVMAVIDLQESQNHLLTITGQPLPGNTSVGTEGQKDTDKRLRTLQDFLQSSTGLLDQQLVFSWVSRLCQSLENLHQHQIVIGDLDPYAILLESDDHSGSPIYRGGPWLAVSWLPPQLRSLLPRMASEQKEISSAIVQATSFSAPEVLLGKVEPVSDVYSLGAILYLLLTGTQPDGLMQRTQQRLRSPHELNPRISGSVNEIVMQALSLEPSERFQSVKALAEALSSRHSSQEFKAHPTPHLPVQNGYHDLQRDQVANIDTINIMPLGSFKNEPSARVLWKTTTDSKHPFPPPDPSALPAERPLSVEGTLESQPAARSMPPEQHDSGLSLNNDEPGQDNSWRTGTSLVQHLSKRISGMLPTIPHLPKQITGMVSPTQPASQTQVEQSQVRMWASPVPRASFLIPNQEATKVSAPTDGTNPVESNASLLKHIQRVLLGERQQTTTAATIENPLRIQPDQRFNIRIRLTGRDEPDPGILPRGRVSDPTRPHSRLYGTMEGIQSSGLGTRVHDDLVYVEVRSAIHENYAYIVQQAAVKIPAQGYVVDIIIPMQPFSRKSNGRRERLHVFFFDELRRPLYERPFVLEILVSYLVQPGREGHHVLPIPQ